MDGELLCEIIKRIKGVAGIKTFLVFTVAAFNLAVVARGIGPDQLMPDLAMMDITKKWTGRRQDWSLIHAQLAVFFADRMPD